MDDAAVLVVPGSEKVEPTEASDEVPVELAASPRMGVVVAVCRLNVDDATVPVVPGSEKVEPTKVPAEVPIGFAVDTE